jgi:hypothetical protein
MASSGNEDLTPGDFELVNRLSILTVARRPEWKRHVDAELGEVPPDANHGEFLENAPVTHLDFQTREQIDARTVYATIDQASGDDYTVTIDGTETATYSASGSDAVPDIVDGVVSAMNSGAPDGTVTADAFDLDGDGNDDTVRILGDQSGDYTVTVSTTGSAQMSLSGDPLMYDVRLWVLPKDTYSNRDLVGWTIHPSSDELPRVDWRGYKLRVPTAGYDRMAIQTFDRSSPEDGVDGLPHIYLGPAQLE